MDKIDEVMKRAIHNLIGKKVAGAISSSVITSTSLLNKSLTQSCLWVMTLAQSLQHCHIMLQTFQTYRHICIYYTSYLLGPAGHLLLHLLFALLATCPAHLYFFSFIVSIFYDIYTFGMFSYPRSSFFYHTEFFATLTSPLLFMHFLPSSPLI